MKNLILFALLFMSIDVFPGTQDMITEKELNQKLLDNAAAAQKNLLDSSGNKIPTAHQILTNKGIGSSSPDNLTDQEKQLSENFVDQAGANKIIKENCSGDNQQLCSGQEVDHKTFGMNPGLIKAVAQAYAMFGSMSSGFLPISPGTGNAFNKAGDAASKPGEAAEKKSVEDYCKYIPTATEAIATFSQKNVVANLSNNGGEVSQKEQILKAAKSHDGRAKQSQIQAVGWYGGAACYGVNMMTGNFAGDANTWIKLAAATFLGSVYQSEVSANKEYAKKTRDIANLIPSKGQCNPITENECYCSTPEYENDPTYCKAQIDARNNPLTFTRVACTDNKLNLDPACNCQKTNSCFDTVLESQGGPTLELGMGFSNSPFKSVASLARGRLEGADLGPTAYAKTSAIAKKILNEGLSKIPGINNPLTSGQKEISDALISRGIPAAAARLMASNPAPASAVSSAMAKTSGLGNYPQYAAYGNNKNNVLDFTGGNGLGVSGRKVSPKNEMEDILGKLKGNGKVGNAKVLEFAQRAEARASQITKSDRPLFEIISFRYQTSGRRLLQLDTSN